MREGERERASELGAWEVHHWDALAGYPEIES